MGNPKALGYPRPYFKSLKQTAVRYPEVLEGIIAEYLNRKDNNELNVPVWPGVKSKVEANLQRAQHG
jgi:hypothetical protein